MVRRTFGILIFLAGLWGVLVTTASFADVQPANSTERSSALLMNLGFWGLLLALGLHLLFVVGQRKPVTTHLERDRDDEGPWPPEVGSVRTGSRSRTMDWKHPESDLELPNRDTGSCAKCGYRPVAYDARFCPACAARNPNPGIVNRIVGKALLFGGLAGGLLGAIWGYFSLGSGGVTGAFGGLLLGSLPGVVLALIGGILAGKVARIFGVR